MRTSSSRVRGSPLSRSDRPPPPPALSRHRVVELCRSSPGAVLSLLQPVREPSARMCVRHAKRSTDLFPRGSSPSRPCSSLPHLLQLRQVDPRFQVRPEPVTELTDRLQPGERRCPQPDCGRQVGKLHRVHQRWCCRACGRLKYESQLLDPIRRGLARAYKTRVLLGGRPSVLEPFPAKPRRMTWARYDRLWEQAQQRERAFLDAERAEVEKLREIIAQPEPEG